MYLCAKHRAVLRRQWWTSRSWLPVYMNSQPGREWSPKPWQVLTVHWEAISPCWLVRLFCLFPADTSQVTRCPRYHIKDCSVSNSACILSLRPKCVHLLHLHSVSSRGVLPRLIPLVVPFPRRCRLLLSPWPTGRVERSVSSHSESCNGGSWTDGFKKGN